MRHQAKSKKCIPAHSTHLAEKLFKEEMSHKPIEVSKEIAPLNIQSMSVTAEVFQEPMG